MTMVCLKLGSDADVGKAPSEPVPTQTGKIEAVTLLTWLVIAAGIALRIVDFLDNRPLWGDEAALANNIVDRTFQDLLLPLAHKQAAAPLFLWAEKCASLAFGSSEYAFRLVPLVCGILAVGLFCVVCRRCLSKWQALLATTLFALGDPLIRYSTEVKQYSSDVFFILLIYWASSEFFRKQTLASSFVLGAAGAIALWFSYPAVFALAVLTVALLAAQLKKSQRLLLTLLPILGWTAALIALFVFHLAGLAVNRGLLELYGASAFAPAGFNSLIPWLIALWHEFTSRSLGITVSRSDGQDVTDLVALILASLGAVSFGRKYPRDFSFLALPALIVLVASSAHYYPLVGRLLLFLAPAGLIFIASAFRPGLSRVSRIAAAFMAIALLWHPVALRVETFGTARTKEDLRPAFDYLLRHWHTGDKLYVYYQSRSPFQFYRKLRGWQEPNVVIGSSHRRDYRLYAAELEHFRGTRRLWLLMSHESQRLENNDLETDYFVTTLNHLGSMRDSQAYVDAHLFLYDLSSGCGDRESRPGCSRPPV